MTRMVMRYLREPRGQRKQFLHQRSIQAKLQAYDLGLSGDRGKRHETKHNIYKSKLFPLRGLVSLSPTGGGGRYSEVGVLGRAARAASSTGVFTPPLSDTLDRFSGRPRATITAIAIATIRRMSGVQRILLILAPSSLKSREGEMGP